MNVALSIFVFCTAVLATGCSQTAGRDIKTDTNISAETNFQLNNSNSEQGITSSDKADNSTSTKGD